MIPSVGHPSVSCTKIFLTIELKIAVHGKHSFITTLLPGPV